MTIGEGIFFSSLFLGTMALYIATKDRWKWKKVGLWTFGVLAILTIGVTASIYVTRHYEERAFKQSEFWGVALGATEGDVKFLKGEPWRQPDEDLWVYDNAGAEGFYVVRFHNGKVDVVSYVGVALNPSLQSINGGSDMERIKQKFGEPSVVSISKDQKTRMWSYDRFNVFFELKQGKVSELGVFDGSRRPGLKFREEKE